MGVGRRVQETSDGTDGMDAGEYILPAMFFFVITEVYGGTRACGKHRDGCGDPRRIRMWYFPFTYTPVFTVSLIFS